MNTKASETSILSVKAEGMKDTDRTKLCFRPQVHYDTVRPTLASAFLGRSSRKAGEDGK